MKDNKEQFFKPDQFNSFADNDGFKELNFEELEGVAGGVVMNETSDQDDKTIQKEKEGIVGPFFG